MLKGNRSRGTTDTPRDNILRRTNNYPVIVSDNKLQAIYYLFGEEEVHIRCTIEIVNCYQKKLVFKNVPTFNGERVQRLRERIIAIIEDVILVSDYEKQNISSRIQTVMNDITTVYISHKEGQNTVHIFSENWEDMDKAKKRLQVHLKRSMPESRIGRFGSEEGNSEVPATRKTESKQMSMFSVRGKLLTIRIYKASSSDVRVDGIVNPVSELSAHGTETTSQLATESQPKRRHFFRKVTELFRPRLHIPVTDLIVTDVNCQNYKRVFNLGLASSANISKYLDTLLDAILKCMCEARNQGLESLAIPPLSSALAVAKPDQIAEVYIRAAKSFNSVVRGGSLREVHFVDITKRTVFVLKNKVESRWCQAHVQAHLQKDTETIISYLKED